MGDFREELKSFFQKWRSSEIEWVTTEELWKEKENQWMEKELEYFTKTEDPVGDEQKKPWKDNEKEWEQNECSQMNQDELLLSLKILLDTSLDEFTYTDLLKYQSEYSEREKHWAHRTTVWLQKEAWYLGRKQYDKSAELKIQLLQEENDKLKASMAEKQNQWRDAERGLEKKISELESQVKELQTELAKKDQLANQEALNVKKKCEAEITLGKEKISELENQVRESNEELSKMKNALDEKATTEEELEKKQQCYQELLEKERLWKQTLDEQKKQTETMKKLLELEMKTNHQMQLEMENQMLEAAKIQTKTNLELQEWMDCVKDQEDIIEDLRKKFREHKESSWETRKLIRHADREDLTETSRKNVTFCSPLAGIEPKEPEKKEQRGFFARTFGFKQKPSSEQNHKSILKNGQPC